ncbi:MAG: ABC transporter permease, partial [Candidatus Micrarchaeota archaeon]|nr:ABC transporter permease [Candidatus Micrarchaeota archaeon]
MGYLEAVYAIWLREFKVYTRERERAVSSLVTPLIWLFAFGAGLGASVTIAGGSYQDFIFPGIVAMNVLFTSMFYGMYIVWDKKLDLLKEMLIAPVPRWVVFIGKALGGLTNALFQVIVLLMVGVLFLGIHLTWGSALATIFYTALFGFFCVSLGLAVGAILSSPDSFSLVMSFVMWP